MSSAGCIEFAIPLQHLRGGVEEGRMAGQLVQRPQMRSGLI